MNFVEMLEYRLKTHDKVVVVTDTNCKKLTLDIVTYLYGEFNESNYFKFSKEYANKLTFYVVRDYETNKFITVLSDLLAKGITSIVVYDTPKHLLRSEYLHEWLSETKEITVDFT